MICLAAREWELRLRGAGMQGGGLGGGFRWSDDENEGIVM